MEVFERLARDLSPEERRAMQSKFQSGKKSFEEPMRYRSPKPEKPVLMEQAYFEQPFFTRLGLLLRSFFSGEKRGKLVEQFLLSKIQRQVDRDAPKLVSYQNDMISAKMYKYISTLRTAVTIFHSPLTRALSNEKSDFYALLGQIEFEDIHTSLQNAVKGESLESLSPENYHAKIRTDIKNILEKSLGQIPVGRRKQMNRNMLVLVHLRKLVFFPYDRVLGLFDSTYRGKRKIISATPLKAIRAHLLELGAALYAFDEPPSPHLLEALFLFDNRENFAGRTGLAERVSQAAKSLDTIRGINSALPWDGLLKLIARDIHYVSKPSGQGDDWFSIYREFWKRCLTVEYRNLADEKRLSSVIQDLNKLWKIENLPILPGMQNSDYPADLRPKYAASLSAASYFFKTIFQRHYYHALNLVKQDGKFYKEDNKQEFYATYARIIKMPERIRALADSMKPEGAYGMERLEIIGKANTKKDVSSDYTEFFRKLDKECGEICTDLIDIMQSLTCLIKGILDGYGGTYDTLANLAHVGEPHHAVFSRSMQSLKTLLDSTTTLFSKMVNLEEIET